ncbi:sulfotransferase domain-containing protein [Salinibacter ruber]|uniref:sulfotransferase domain-containing protein n=1 Tax=Salinibacter ruber TaxID=146919 RepID=UPI002166F351|nr:sulfotransferase domain-containing protein [Salinibacter ruber]MCS4188214.1 hypothetical protein [Salinibacter ruber]
MDRLEDCRVTRFERDPRDLVVSGYYYHKDASEHWTEIVAPTDADFRVVNGHAPGVLRDRDMSFAGYLNEVDKEQGLIAEAKFRKYHFDAMRKWSRSAVPTFRYRDIIGNEVDVFEQVFNEYDVTAREKKRGLKMARKYALGGEKEQSEHIRNPNPSQWREHFTPAVKASFNNMYPDLIPDTGYDEQGEW